MTRWRGIVVFLTFTVLVVGASGVSAANTKKGGNNCISPSGDDLNAFYGVSEQIVAPFCTQVGSGERWTVTVRWFMNETFEVVPEGFAPAGATPLEDFIAKFSAVRYVVDPGTKHEKTYVFANDGNLWTGVLGGSPLVNTITLGSLDPLPVGTHVVETHWVFSTMHCDGLGEVIAPYLEGGNCLLGEDTVSRLEFEVTPDQR